LRIPTLALPTRFPTLLRLQLLFWGYLLLCLGSLLSIVFSGASAVIPVSAGVRVLAVLALGCAVWTAAPRARTVYSRLTWALLVYVAAELAYLYFGSPLANVSSQPGLSDILFLLFYGLAVWALKPLTGRLRMSWWSRLNIAAATLTLALPLWVLLARQLQVSNTLSWWAAVGYLTLDLWLLNAVLQVYFSRVTRAPLHLGLLALGVGLIVVGDTNFVISSAVGKYVPSSSMSACLTAGLAVFGLAGLAASAFPERPVTSDPARHASSHRKLRALTGLPYAALGVAFTTWWFVSDSSVAETLMFLGIMLLTLLISVRQARLGARQARLLGRLTRTSRELRQSKEQLRRLVYCDELTHLPNRRALTEQLDGWYEAGLSFGLLFLDLDGFKSVNDTYGHATGNEVLRETGARLTVLARSSPDVLSPGILSSTMPPSTILASRLSGDEFALAYQGDLAQGAALQEQLQALLTAPIQVDLYRVQVGVSVGVAHTTSGLSTTSALLSAADHLMYAAKRRRKLERQQETGHAVAET
jgi:diguanylate cyclase (GGDEF)-like protein